MSRAGQTDVDVHLTLDTHACVCVLYCLAIMLDKNGSPYSISLLLVNA